MEVLINCHLDRSGRLHGEGETGGREAGLGHGGARATATLARPCATWHLGIHARRMAQLPRDLIPWNFIGIRKLKDSSASVGMTNIGRNDKHMLRSE